MKHTILFLLILSIGCGEREPDYIDGVIKRNDAIFKAQAFTYVDSADPVVSPGYLPDSSTANHIIGDGALTVDTLPAGGYPTKIGWEIMQYEKTGKIEGDPLHVIVGPVRITLPPNWYTIERMGDSILIRPVK